MYFLNVLSLVHLNDTLSKINLGSFAFQVDLKKIIKMKIRLVNKVCVNIFRLAQLAKLTQCN